MQQHHSTRPTLANIKANFGRTSVVFCNAMTILQNHLPALVNDPHWQTSYQQWKNFLTLVYGKFDNSPEVFLVHTYLSMFAKLLAYTVLMGQVEYLPTETLQKILQGEQFDSLNVERFVVDDFYAWIAVPPHFTMLQTIGRDLMQQLTEYDFTQGVQEDILKGVYQELIDLETRHALGEYYTPDWLCERILAGLPVQAESYLLDPACGSGSFLRAAIARLRREFPDLTATQLTQQVVGIDIHPLSVQIAKATIILALSDLIRRVKEPVTLNVYLANSLLLPDSLAGQPFESPGEGYHALNTIHSAGQHVILQQVLKGRFDRVIGNPPWLTYADVSNVSYRKKLYALAQQYDLIPNAKANLSHLEIAAIFLAHCINYFLKATGSLVFVLPRSFLTADQHDNTRSGQVKGLELTEIWDLQGVSPLFRVPAAVVFAKLSVELSRQIPETGITGYLVQGKLDSPQCDWQAVEQALEFTETRWYYSLLSKAKTVHSALTLTKYVARDTQGYYAPLFKDGATIIPRCFYFVEIIQQEEKSNLTRNILSVRTSQLLLQNAKLPWKNLTLAGCIHRDFLFRTALSKNVVPFVLINPPRVLLPLLIKENQGKVIELLTPEQLLERGELELAKWFTQAEELWEAHKTEKAKESAMKLYDRLDFQKGLTAQNLNLRYIVLYTASGQDANAVVIDRETLDLEFLVDSKTYWFATARLNEANYLASFLNSGYPNRLIKDFQSRGLFGPRDVCKKILDVPFPSFEEGNDLHRTLAHLGQACVVKAKLVVGNDQNLDLNPSRLGWLRRRVRVALQKELQEIDRLVEEISRTEWGGGKN